MGRLLTGQQLPQQKSKGEGRNNMKEMIKRFLKDEEGATAVEYGLMVALIAAVIVAAVTLLGENVRDTFNGVAAEIQPPVAPT